MARGVEIKSASGLGVNRVQEKLASGAGKKEGKTSFWHDNGITGESRNMPHGCLGDGEICSRTNSHQLISLFANSSSIYEG